MDFMGKKDFVNKQQEEEHEKEQEKVLWGRGRRNTGKRGKVGPKLI